MPLVYLLISCFIFLSLCLRPSVIIAGDWTIFLLLFQIVERFSGRLPGYMGSGNDIESFCHVEDVAKGHIAAMYKGRFGERYLLTGENVSFNQVIDRSAFITRTRKPWFHIPLWLIEIYGWISVFFAKVTGKLPLISYPVCFFAIICFIFWFPHKFCCVIFFINLMQLLIILFYLMLDRESFETSMGVFLWQG